MSGVTNKIDQDITMDDYTDRIFKMGWSKATYVVPAIGIALQLFMSSVLFVAFPPVGLLFLAFILFMVWMQYKSIRSARYIVTDNEIRVKRFWYKTRNFRVDKIRKIVYIDLGTDFGRNPPNARYQLLIYFERTYLKSVMPIRVGPADRDGFVDALLELNADIEVDRSDMPTSETECFMRL